jgi:phosphoglycerol transferase MdoB-like AlkP superfamily enzyme
MSQQAKKAFKLNKENESYLESNLIILQKHQILMQIVVSIVMVLVLEMLSRRSISQGLGFITENPLMFLFNTMIVLLSLSLSMMFSKRYFMMLLIGVIWLGLGIANFVIQCFRLTPLTFMDFYVLKSVAGIFHMYVDSIRMILIAFLLAVLLTFMFISWRKAKRYQKQVRIPALVIGITTISMLLLSSFAVKVSALSDDFTNLPDAYADYGFAYCFSNSVIDRGIKEPEGYSEAEVSALVTKINSSSNKFTSNDTSIATSESLNITEDSSNDTNQVQTLGVDLGNDGSKQPNIIMLQLESFIDANHLINYSYSENPVPNFTKLKEEYSSGYLTVPVYGAGTINTEFEVLSGMSIDFFGTSEYPYRTILQSTTAESVCYNLSSLGYRSYVIHNNTGTFYSRNSIFPKLGFDHFVSLEYMNDVEYNPTGWAKDKVLTKQILSALNEDTNKDFIYTITVQSHGKYQEVPTEENLIKASTSLPDTSEAFLHQVEYYVNQAHQTDAFVGDLLSQLSTFNEPTVVVMFGDHQPPLDFDETDLINGNKFQTEYVIWSNYPMENEKLDLSAYQLSSYVMSRIGYDDGILTKFHQRCFNNPDYKEDLQLLQYDMLYGQQYVFNGVNPYLEKTMKMGIQDPKVTDMQTVGDVIYIQGENFTPWSVVYIDGNAKETTFVNETTLSFPVEEFENPVVYVAQETDGNTILSQSQEWTK